MQIQDIQHTPIQNPNFTSATTYNNNCSHCHNNQSHHVKSTLLSPVAAPSNHDDIHIHSCLSISHDDDDPQKQQKEAATPPPAAETFAPAKELTYKREPKKEEERSSSSGPRERLKRHRVEVSSSMDRVWIPDIWGQEGFLKDWIDCAAFDASLVAATIANARDSLMEESKRIRRSSPIPSSPTINNNSSSNNNNNNSSNRVLLRVNSST